jgi:hypothetical protein
VRLELTAGGFEEVAKNIAAAKGRYRGGLVAAAVRLADLTMSRATQHAPVLTGALKGSAYVTTKDLDSASPVVSFGFSAPYAAFAQAHSQKAGGFFRGALMYARPIALSLLAGWVRSSRGQAATSRFPAKGVAMRAARRKSFRRRSR